MSKCCNLILQMISESHPNGPCCACVAHWPMEELAVRDADMWILGREANIIYFDHEIKQLIFFIFGLLLVIRQLVNN